MAYIKQDWSSYDETKSLEENVIAGAVATADRLEHIEDGIAEIDAKSFDSVEVTTVGANIDAEANVIDGVLHMTIPTGPAGAAGEPGENGEAGADGKSAYEIAVEKGFEGTEEEWLASLKGEPGVDGTPGEAGVDGKSAYEIAVEKGFEGTEEEWLASLKGADGDNGSDGTPGLDGTNGVDGKSAYEIAVEGGFEGDEAAWLASLKGETGERGADGRSAYQIAVDNGYQGTEEEWANQMSSGEGILINGKSAYDIAIDEGFQGTKEEWLASLKGETGDKGETGLDGAPGADGADGKSAYDIAVEGGFEGDETAWLASLKGETGSAGADGKSAYEIAVEKGFEGTEEEWLASLKGETGADGTPGIGVSAYDPVMDTEDPTTGIIDADDITPAIAVGSHFIAPSGELFEVVGETDGVYTVSKTAVNLGSSGGNGEAAGKDGVDGKSAYQIAVDGGFTGTEEEWLASLKGEAGAAGKDGVDGKSAYEIAVEGGFEGDETAWLASLDGTDGVSGHSVGVAVVNPIDDEIAASQINSVSQVGDHFIAPSGEIYKIINTKEGQEDIYMVENTGVTMSGASIDFKGEAIGHCSGLEVSTLSDTAENQKKPPINITYTDPVDEGVPYGGTVVAIKEGSEPTSPDDADIIENTMDKDKYKTSPLVIVPPRTGGNEAHTKTFFATLFPYSASGVYNLLKKESKSVVLSYAEYVKNLRLNYIDTKTSQRDNTYTYQKYSGKLFHEYNGKQICLNENNKTICEFDAATKELTTLYTLPDPSTIDDRAEICDIVNMFVISNKIYLAMNLYEQTGTIGGKPSYGRYKFTTLIYDPDTNAFSNAGIFESTDGGNLTYLDVVEYTKDSTDYFILLYIYNSTRMVLLDANGNVIENELDDYDILSYKLKHVTLINNNGKLYTLCQAMDSQNIQYFEFDLDIDTGSATKISQGTAATLERTGDYNTARPFQLGKSIYVVSAFRNTSGDVEKITITKLDSFGTLSTTCTYDLSDLNLASTGLYISSYNNFIIISCTDRSSSIHYILEEVEIDE